MTVETRSLAEIFKIGGSVDVVPCVQEIMATRVMAIKLIVKKYLSLHLIFLSFKKCLFTEIYLSLI